MKRYKHLFEQVVSPGNLLGAARNALRGKRYRQPGAQFLLNFEKELFDLRDELASGTYPECGPTTIGAELTIHSVEHLSK